MSMTATKHSARFYQRFTRTDFILLGAVGLSILGLWAWKTDDFFYEWEWSVVSDYLIYVNPEDGSWRANLLLEGLAATLRLTVWGAIIAIAIGVVMGCFRVSNSLFLRFLSRSFVESIRNIPPLVVIFMFYFFISSQLMPLIGLDEWVRGLDENGQYILTILFGPLDLIENFIAGLIVLALFEASYFAEIIRAGIQSIGKGQWEAAQSIGLRPLKVMRFVIIPQAVQRTIPPLAGQLISLVKDSAIVSLISVQDLTYTANQVVNSTWRPFEIWIFVAAVYFVLCFSISLVSRSLEKKMNRGNRQ